MPAFRLAPCAATTAVVLTLLAAAPAFATTTATSGARLAFARAHGDRVVLDLDRLTGTPRQLGLRDGFLSRPAVGTPRAVALRWVRAHLPLLGLTRSDLATLRLAREYRSPDGVTHLMWRQLASGIPAFGSSLRVHVTRDGRIIAITGSPRHGLAIASARPRLSAGQALAAAARLAHGRLPQLAPRIVSASSGPRRETRFAGGDNAILTLYESRGVVRLAWRVWYTASSTAVWDTVIDADSGRLLWRTNRVLWANVTAWDNYPGAAKGGQPKPRDASAWLTATDRLEGNNAHVYVDADGTDMAEGPVEDVGPNEGNDWNYAYMSIPSPAGNCPVAGCDWNHLVNGSWVLNREVSAQQVFFFVNTYHDHLQAPPISFTEAAGNFQVKNATGEGKGGDALQAEPMDSAALVAGRPVPLITSDNANMATPPDGQAPRMQMYLFEPVVVPTVIDYPFSDVHGGDDAVVVYHEYTHGLSNRLITDADGNGALDSAQAGAMGEAWSDWYAFDFLMKQGLYTDTEAPGELLLGEFESGKRSLVRTEPVDCTPGAPAAVCPRERVPAGNVPGTGGYTYADFGKIAGSAEVHADGEIWVQTLIDLRRRLVADEGPQAGAEHAESLITRAMDLSPPEPSYLNMRNAILQADTAAGGCARATIWEVFAARGMGTDAKTADGTDTEPTAGFKAPAVVAGCDVPAAPITTAPPVPVLAPRAHVVVGLARVTARRPRLVATITTDRLVRVVTVTVRDARSHVVASGRARAIRGRVKLTLRLHRIPHRGAYTIAIRYKEADGRSGKLVRKVRI
jgi:extracellular elastinolytic metalloproteinase